MSTFPKARKSMITNVSVTPAKWDAHPEVSYSTISDSTFTNCSSATRINNSTISQSTLEDLTGEQQTIKHNDVNRSHVQDSAVHSSRINRSKLNHCSITDSTVNRSTLKHCTVLPRNQIDRSTARATKFVGSKLVNRSQLEDCAVLGGSTVDRCVLRNAVVADNVTCSRTKMDNVVATRSRIDRSKLSNCDVMDCVMDRTTFEGMILKYGIWKNGDLVGRIANEEVVIKPRTHPVGPPDTSSTESPAAQPRAASAMQEPGWKAAEAASEQLDDSDRPDDALSSDDNPLTDDEVTGAAVKPIARTVHATSSAGTADKHDPPPPYEA